MARSSKSFSVAIAQAGDFGMSRTKPISQLADGLLSTQPTDPQVVELNPDDLKDPRFRYKPNLPPENQAWVSYGKGTFVVGNLARVKHGQLHIHQLKQTRIVPKALTAIWAAYQQHGLNNKAGLAFVGQLPAGEMPAREALTQELSEALKGFETPTGTFKIKARIRFVPEGSGIAAYKEATDPDFSDKVCAFFMLGFRNASVLVMERGVESIVRSSKWGFAHLVQEVSDSDKVVEQSIEILTPVLAEAFDPKQLLGREGIIDRQPFYRITHHHSGSNQTEEVDRLVVATEQACDRYLRELMGWMQDVLNELTVRCDEVILSGGTAETLKRAINRRWLSTFPEHSFHGGVKLPEDFDDKGLGVRLFDPYAALLGLTAEVFPHLAA